MNEQKLNRILQAARTEVAPEPTPGFEARVLRAIRVEELPPTLADQLSALLPKMAWTAAVLVTLCLAAEYGSADGGFAGISDGVAQVSGQWLVPMGGI